MHFMNFDDIGQAIRSARKTRKLSQAELAAGLGMSRATISGIENGTIVEIGVRKIVAVCSALGLELAVQAQSRRPTLQKLRQEQVLRVRELRSNDRHRTNPEKP
jgi:HTH-type transcriptional regulator / antitoxin HipB